MDTPLSEAPVSLIICARNEAENLKRLLPAIAAQEYHSFQVVLVNDASTDETASVMDAFKKNSQDQTYSVQVILNDILAYSYGTHVITIGVDLFQGLSNCRCTY